MRAKSPTTFGGKRVPRVAGGFAHANETRDQATAIKPHRAGMKRAKGVVMRAGVARGKLTGGMPGGPKGKLSRKPLGGYI